MPLMHVMILLLSRLDNFLSHDLHSLYPAILQVLDPTTLALQRQDPSILQSLNPAILAMWMTPYQSYDFVILQSCIPSVLHAQAFPTVRCYLLVKYFWTKIQQLF